MDALEDEAFWSNSIVPNLAPNLDNTNGRSFGRNLHEPDHGSNNAFVLGNSNFNTTNPLEDEAFLSYPIFPSLAANLDNTNGHSCGSNLRELDHGSNNAFVPGNSSFNTTIPLEDKAFSSYPMFPSLTLNLDNANGRSFGRNLREPDHGSNNAFVPGNFNFNTAILLEDEAFSSSPLFPSLAPNLESARDTKRSAAPEMGESSNNKRNKKEVGLTIREATPPACLQVPGASAAQANLRSDLGIPNSLYDPMYQRLGLPLDPLLRRFLQEQEKEKNKNK